MSEVPQIPRLLATLLGVEPPAPSGPRRAAPAPQAPPAPSAPSVPGPSVVPGGPAAERAGRRPQEPSGSDAGATATRSSARVQRSMPPPPGTRRTIEVRTGVREALAARDALRTGVVVAEVLGRPRALRPYGSDDAR